MTSLCCHRFVCAVRVSCWQVREYGRKHVHPRNERIFRYVRNTALAASFLSLPPYCENNCGNKVTSEVDITCYFGHAIQIPFLRVKRYEFEGLPRPLRLCKRVFLKANFKTKENQVSVHRHFKYTFTRSSLKDTPFQQCKTSSAEREQLYVPGLSISLFFQDHQAQCPYTKVQCMYPSCGVLVLREDLSRHLEEECMFRQQQCQYCKLMTTADKLKV